MNKPDIGFIIQHYGEELEVTGNATDQYGFTTNGDGSGDTRNIIAVIEFNSLQDQISPGSAKMYTNETVVIGERLDYYNKSFKIVSQNDDCEYIIEEFK